MATEQNITSLSTRETMRQALNRNGIFSYKVRHEDGKEQLITCKMPLITEGEIIPNDGEIIKDLPAISGHAPYDHFRPAFQRERVIEEVRAQANLAGAFHAVHKLVMGEAIPQDAPINERYVPFTAVPVFVQR